MLEAILFRLQTTIRIISTLIILAGSGRGQNAFLCLLYFRVISWQLGSKSSTLEEFQIEEPEFKMYFMAVRVGEYEVSVGVYEVIIIEPAIIFFFISR